MLLAETHQGLAPIDWIIIAAYAAATIGLGWYYSRRQKSTQEYFVGSGHMNPLLIGVSLFATLLSTISYLSMPGEALGKGPVHMLSTLLVYPFVFLIVGFVLLPVYMRQRVTSAYELLEARLGLSIRLLGASMFIALRLVWMALLVYLTAKAVAIMIGIPAAEAPRWIPWIALTTGSIAVIYTSLGGLRAVVITDFMQTTLLYGGALLVLGVVTFDLGGFHWFPTEWNPIWDRQPIISVDPSTRVTVFSAFLSFLIWYVCTSGGDQTSVQRFMSTSDARAARRALATQLCVAVIVGLTLGLVGFALLGYYTAHPELVPETMTLKQHADDAFPRFIAYHLPAGISGLVVSAMFAAAMSSVDSGVNSITAVVLTDFLDRFGKRPQSERGHVLLARLLALSIGTAVVLGSSFMQYIPGNITAVTNKTSNLLTTPIFCLFFFALFVPFSRPLGVWIGAVFGTATAAVIAFSGPIVLFLATRYDVDPAAFGVELITRVDLATGTEFLDVSRDPISFQWIAPVALLVNIAVGTLSCLVISAVTPESKTESETMSPERGSSENTQS